MFGRDADDIAMTEAVNADWRNFRQRYEEDARGLVGKLDDHLRNFKVMINLGLMRQSLERQKTSIAGFYIKNSNYVGDDHLTGGFINDMYELRADLRSSPWVVGVKRQLFIYNPLIRVREALVLTFSKGAEATLTSENKIVIVPYQERDRPDNYQIDKGFFVDDKELDSDIWYFGFGAEGLKKVDIPFEI